MMMTDSGPPDTGCVKDGGMTFTSNGMVQNGSVQSWTVPMGVCGITIDAFGAQGGGQSGGKGAEMRGAPSRCSTSRRATARRAVRTSSSGSCVGIGFGKILRIGDIDVFGQEVNAASKLGEDTAKSDEILVTGAVKAAAQVEGVKYEKLELSVPGSAENFRVLYSSRAGGAL